jgi:hypothetical protein
METAPQPTILFYFDNIKEVLFFRFMLFCDQCHDFCEFGRDNAWIEKKKSSSGAPPLNKVEILKYLRDSYVEDIKWFFSRLTLEDKRSFFNASAEGVIAIPVVTFLEKIFLVPSLNSSRTDFNFTFSKEITDKMIPLFNSTDRMVEHIDTILETMFEIIPISSGEFMSIESQGNPCSQSADIAELIMTADKRTKNLDYTNRYIAVDADKSKMNLSSLLLLLCDKVAYPDNGVFGIKTAATQYDAASGSGTFSYLEKIKNSYIQQGRGNVKIVFKNYSDPQIFHIKYKDEIIYNFEYIKYTPAGNEMEPLDNIIKFLSEIIEPGANINDSVENYGELDVSTEKGIGKSIKDKIKSICGIQTNVTVSKWIKNEIGEAAPDGMDAATLKKYLVALYIHLEKKKGQYLEIFTQFEELKQSNLKYIVRMKIHQFFSKKFDEARVLNKGINDDGSSVSAITSMAPPEGSGVDADWVKYITCFKTNSDLGQMHLLKTAGSPMWCAKSQSEKGPAPIILLHLIKFVRE